MGEEVMVNTTVHLLHTIIEIKISTKEISCIEDIDSHTMNERKEIIIFQNFKNKKKMITENEKRFFYPRDSLEIENTIKII